MAVSRRKKMIQDTGLTARYLVGSVPGYVVFNGDFVKALTAKRKSRNGDIWYECSTRTSIPGEKPRTHYQKIHVLGGGSQRAGQSKVRLKVECDCEYHCFTCEVALHRYGAADIIHSNGEFPHTTNPRGIPTVCKHLYVLLKGLIRSGN